MKDFMTKYQFVCTVVSVILGFALIPFKLYSLAAIAFIFGFGGLILLNLELIHDEIKELKNRK
jgi:hypothetical protein